MEENIIQNHIQGGSTSYEPLTESEDPRLGPSEKPQILISQVEESEQEKKNKVIQMQLGSYYKKSDSEKRKVENSKEIVVDTA